MPLISIIIPVYNGEKTIQETIWSLMNQTVKDFEILVINDGSTDGTLDIISSINEPRIKVHSFENSGVSVSRNRGISLATGEYISFIDADDLWTREKLELQLKVLQVNPQAALAYSWTNWINEAGKFIYGGGHHSFSGNVYAHLFLGDFIEGGSNVLIRRSVFEEMGGFNEAIQHSEDWEMWLRIAQKYEFVAVPLVQILYRISTQSASSNVIKMERTSLEIIEQAITQSPYPIKHLKSHSLANRYKYLTYKVLEDIPAPKNGWIAIRFLWKAVKNDPSLIQKRVFWKALIKTLIILLLPSPLSQRILKKLSHSLELKTILMHMKTTPELTPHT